MSDISVGESGDICIGDLQCPCAEAPLWNSGEGVGSAPHTSWTSYDLGTCRDVSRDHTSRAHDSIIANRDTWEDDCSTPNPDITANADMSSELQTCPPLLGIMRMVGGVDLHGRSDLRSF